MTLYNLRSALNDYRITKFTKHLDVESSYIISATPPHKCECPAGTRPTCRHRQMLPELLARHMLDSELFWDFERGMSVDADGNPSRVTKAEPEIRSPDDIYTEKDLTIDMFAKDVTPTKHPIIADLPAEHSAHSGDVIGRWSGRRI